MKLLVLFFFFYITSAYSQQTIDKLNSNQLKLPKESVSKALILDATGQVKSSSTVSDTELSYLDGLTDTLLNLLSGKANDTDVVKLTTNQSISGTKTFTGKIVASSTVNGSIPCPVMTETQRNAFTATQGDCVFNSTSLKLTIYDGAVWKDAGGAGGVSLWLTANPYIINDVVIESDRIYRCIVAHTSGTFATDLAASRWVEVSASPSTPYSLANGGTNKALTASNGGVVWVDADSFEILAPGTSGQVLQSNAAAAPSWVNKSVSAKSDNAASVTLEEIQVANNQLTQTATNKHRVEIGNSNILVNPSFEHSTFSTGWTNSAGTFTEETVLEIDGLKAAKLVLSSQTMSLTQSSTLYASQFADGGTQGLAMVRVKSDVALKVCAIQAGVVSTSLCVDVPAHNKWGLYKVPFILGATSNGISIASVGNVTGTVYVDEGFLGAVDLPATQSFDTTCDTISCQTTFGAFVSGSGVVSSESTDFINGNCSLSGTSSNRKACTFSTSLFSVAPTCSMSTIGCVSEAGGCNNTSNITSLTNTGISFSGANNPDTAWRANDIYMTCVRSGSDYTAAINAQKAFQKSKVSSFSSTNADTDWASCGHTTSSFTGFGTVSVIETQCKRQGGDLLMKGRFTSGASTATEARLSLPLWNGVQLTSKGVSVIPSIQFIGNAYRNVSSAIHFGSGLLIEPSVSYLTFGAQNSTTAIPTKQTGTGLISNTEVFAFETVRIPVAQFENSNIIIGQFNGLESCTDSYQCTDTLSFSVSNTGVVSNENLDTVSGNCTVSDTSLFTCTYRSGLQGNSVNLSGPLNCAVSIDDANSTDSSLAKLINTSSSTQLVFRTGYGSTPPLITKSAYATKVICQKQGVDYIGKTAKAVASDQNLRTPGVTKAVMYSARISATGVVSNEAGDFINGNCTMTNPTNTCPFISATFASAPNCVVVFDDNGLGTLMAKINNLSTSSTQVGYVTQIAGANTYQAEDVNIICHGVSP
jgi:hypothetical protein